MYPNLEAELGRRKMSKKTLSEIADIRYNTLIDKCNNKSGFTLDEALKISKVLNTPLTIEELFKRETA